MQVGSASLPRTYLSLEEWFYSCMYIYIYIYRCLRQPRRRALIGLQAVANNTKNKIKERNNGNNILSKVSPGPPLGALLAPLGTLLATLES